MIRQRVGARALTREILELVNVARGGGDTARDADDANRMGRPINQRVVAHIAESGSRSNRKPELVLLRGGPPETRFRTLVRPQ